MQSKLVNLAKIGASLGSFALAGVVAPADGCISKIIEAIAGNLASNFVNKYDPGELLKLLRGPDTELNHDIEKLMIECVPKAVELVVKLYKLVNPYKDKYIDDKLNQLYEEAKLISDNRFEEIGLTTDENLWLKHIHEYIFRGHEDSDGKLAEIEIFFVENLPRYYKLVFTEGLKSEANEKPLKAFLIKNLQGLAYQAQASAELQRIILKEIAALRQDKPAKSQKVARRYFKTEFNNLSSQLTEILGIIKKTETSVELLITEISRLSASMKEPHILRLSFEQAVENYIKEIIRSTSKIVLPGIKEEKILPTIPLEKVYVSLKVQKKITKNELARAFEFFERKVNDEIRKLGHAATEKDIQEAQYRVIESNSIMKRFLDKSRQNFMMNEPNDEEKNFEIINFAEAFKKQRLLMVLGGPGSGKSTTTKWITHQLAKSLLKEIQTGRPQRVKVKLNQVDARKSEDDSTTEDLGPARIPLLINVSEYAKHYSTSKTKLIDFLNDTCNELAGVYQNKYDIARQYLSKGRAVVLLDGMDEISVDRKDINRIIERFIEEWIEKRGSLSEDDEVLLPPDESGGNQIVITSRITGYYTFPLNLSNITHVTIERMDERSIRHFCDVWSFQVDYNENVKILTEKEISDLAVSNSDDLKAAIFDEKNPNVHELAGTPLLVTVLAVVFRNDKKLPSHRAQLYERVTSILVENLRKLDSVSINEIYYILVSTAHFIHQSSSDNIGIHDLKRVVKKAVCEYRNKEIESMSMEEEDRIVIPFVKLVQEKVGLLAESGNNIFRFLHRSFQEFLAAIYLIRDRNTAINQIITCLEDPIWREPIYLALGYLSLSVKEVDFKINIETDAIIRELLNADDPIKDLIPRGALFVADAIPEMEVLSNDIIEEIVYRLIDLFYEEKQKPKHKSLELKLEKVISNLYSGAKKGVIEQLFRGILRNREAHNAGRIAVTTYLIDKYDWMDETYEPLLVKLLNTNLQSRYWGFPIDSALRKFRSKEFRTSAHEHLALKRSITAEHLKKIREDPKWIRLMVCFYGGFPDKNFSEDWLNLQKFKKNLNLGIGTSDDRYNQAVKLDTTGGDVEKNILSLASFNPQFIHRDSHFTKQILRLLNSGEDFNVLREIFTDAIENSADVFVKAEALLGLSLFGRKNVEYFITRDSREEYVGIFFEEIKRVSHFLKKHFTHIYAFYTNKSNTERLKDFFGLLQDESDRITILKKLYEIINRFDLPPLDFSYSIPEKRLFEVDNDEEAAMIEAEGWIQRMCYHHNDPVYNLIVMLDTVPNLLKGSLPLFTKSLANLDRTYNIGNFFYFSEEERNKFRLDATDDQEIVLQAIRNINLIPNQFDFLKDWILWSFEPYFKKYPLTLIHAIIISFELSVRMQFSKIVPEIIEIGNLKTFLKSYEKRQTKLINFDRSNIERFKDIIGAPNSITDPDEPEIVFRRFLDIFMSLPKSFWQDIDLDNLSNLLSKVQNLHNRIRIGCQLAYLYPRFLNEVIPLISLSDDIYFKKSILTDILTEFGHNHENRETVIKLYESSIVELGEERILSVDTIMNSGSHEIWPFISLISLFDECEQMPFTEKHVENLWATLDVQPDNEAIIETLLEGAEITGLNLSSTALETIRKMESSSSQETLALLLPFLEIGSQDVLNNIDDWKNSSNKLFRIMYNLMAAEHGVLNKENIDILSELLNSENDRLRYRAAKAIHGINASSDNQIRKFRLSHIDVDTLAYLHKKKKICHSVSARSKLAWFNHNFIYDESEKLQDVVDCIERQENNYKSLFPILGNIESASADVLKQLPFLLQSKNMKVRSELLKSICRLVYVNHQPTDHLLLSIGVDAIKILNDLKIMDFSFEMITNLIQGSEGKAIQELYDQLLERSILSYDYSSMNYSKDLKHYIFKIGKLYYINTENHLSDAKTAFYPLRNAEPQIRTLAKWTFKILADELLEDENNQLGSYLSTLMIYTTEENPMLFEDIVKQDIYDAEGILVNTVLSHSSWVTRRSGIVLLSYLPSISDESFEALIAAMKDVYYVVEGVEQCWKYFTSIYDNEKCRHKLYNLIESGSGSICVIASKILSEIAKNAKCPEVIRKEIIAKLVHYLRLQRSSVFRKKYIYSVRNSEDMVFQGTSDQIIYDEIIKLTSLF